MSRRAVRITQADIARAARAAKQTGVPVDILPDGTIRIMPLESAPAKLRAADISKVRDFVL